MPSEREATMNSYKNRIMRAIKLDAHLYEEVEADKGAMMQAMLTVVLSSIAAGIGSITIAGTAGILTGTILALISWFVWAFLTFIVGTKLLPEPKTRSDIGELLRTIGFSSSPGLIRIIGIIPGLFRIVAVIASVWMIVAMVIAVRQALDYKSTLRAVGVCLISWIIQVLMIAGVFYFSGGIGKPV